MQSTLVDGITQWRFESFPQDGRISHAVFGRTGGVSDPPLDSLNLSSSVKDDQKSVIENQKRAYGSMGRQTSTLVHAHLKHGNNVVRVGRSDHENVIPDCDGLITNDPDCGLAMNFADCGSIFLYDLDNHAIGLGHAGWRGAIANLPGAMVEAMQNEFGTNPLSLVAGLGPCISAARYEVDEPVISEVNQRFPKWADRLLTYDPENASGRPHFNLALANHINLYEAGAKEVELPMLCTAARTDLFFSHRAEKGKTGRFGAVFILGARS